MIRLSYREKAGERETAFQGEGGRGGTASSWVKGRFVGTRERGGSVCTAASIYGKHSVGPSIRPICTRCNDEYDPGV